MIVSQKLRSSSDVTTMTKKTLNVNLPCIPRGWLRNSCRKIKRFYLKLRRRLRYKLHAKKSILLRWRHRQVLHPSSLSSIFTSPIIHLVCPPAHPPPPQKKNCISIVFNSLGTTVIPRRNWKQTLCKLLGWRGKQDVQMVNRLFIHVVENRLAGHLAG